MIMLKKWLIGIAIALVLILLITPSAINYFLWKQVEVPSEDPVEVVWTDQNWTPEQWQWWYHISQGSGLETVIPYDWFLALEQPKLSIFRPGAKLTELKYLAGFGFLPNQKNAYNPDGLPVGFAKTENFFNPVNNETNTVVGFTCAACHTGQLNYQGKGIRLEGGPGMIELTKFKKAIGLSLLLTRYDPFRFNRFANQILGENSTSEEKTQLKEKLKSLVAEAVEIKNKTENFYPVEEGFGRLDALERIGNFVFGNEINFDNYRAVNAPVNYPHIWSSPWLDWVQYNGSIMQPMTRNAGEAMGVFARVNLDANSPDVFKSNVNVKNLYEIEKLLTGDSIFTGLTAPKWNEQILGAIDPDKAAKGKQLYQNYCQKCHLPSMDSAEFKDDKYWTTLGKNQELKYLQVTMKNLYEIGTDPTTATNWSQRLVNLETLAQKHNREKGFEFNGIVTGGFALPFVVEKTVEQKYDELALNPEEREAFNGYRPNEVRAPLGYKARPLNGIWATAPFLHNGSVPNLYQMLVPATERSEKFYLGTKEFDPKFVGFKTEKIPGGFLLDTKEIGNANTGHEFKGDGTGAGVVGPELSDEERWALVEYLKTL